LVPRLGKEVRRLSPRYWIGRVRRSIIVQTEFRSSRLGSGSQRQQMAV
jgi:hypothetical protein